jgi:hypothetical protein
VIVDHGFVVDRERVLVGDFGKGVETGAGAACKDDTFHVLFLQMNFLG